MNRHILQVKFLFVTSVLRATAEQLASAGWMLTEVEEEGGARTHGLANAGFILTGGGGRDFFGSPGGIQSGSSSSIEPTGRPLGEAQSDRSCGAGVRLRRERIEVAAAVADAAAAEEAMKLVRVASVEELMAVVVTGGIRRRDWAARKHFGGGLDKT